MGVHKSPQPGPLSIQDGREPWQKWLLFAAGYLGWYLISGLIWLLFNFMGDQSYYINIFCFPANVIILLILAIFRESRLIALGILAALAVNFAISLVGGLTLNVWCFVPFFVK